MSREDALDDLLRRLAVATSAADELGLDLTVYLLSVTILEVLEQQGKRRFRPSFGRHRHAVVQRDRLPPVKQPAEPGRKIYAARCERCDGKGWIAEPN